MEFLTKNIRQLLFVSIVLVTFAVQSNMAPEVLGPFGYPVKEAFLGLVASVVSAGIGIAKGLSQKKQAKKLEKTLIRPKATISKGVTDNVAIAKELAGSGLSGQEMDAATAGINTSTASAIRGNFLYGRNGANANAIARAASEATTDLNAESARIQREGAARLMAANQDLAAEEQRVFEYNEVGEYNQGVKNVTELRAAGNENTFGGINNILATASIGANAGSALGGFDSKNVLNGIKGLFKRKTSVASPLAVSAANNISFSNPAYRRSTL